MTATPKILWVDEDQGEWPVVAWVIARCGAVVQPAFTVEEGLLLLAEGRPEYQPAAILLDVIVRSALQERTRDRYSGLEVWRKLSPSQRARTLMLSVVPYHHLREQGDIPPEQQFFWKVELGAHLPELEEAIRALLQKKEA